MLLFLKKSFKKTFLILMTSLFLWSSYASASVFAAEDTSSRKTAVNKALLLDPTTSSPKDILGLGGFEYEWLLYARDFYTQTGSKQVTVKDFRLYAKNIKTGAIIPTEKVENMVNVSAQDWDTGEYIGGLSSVNMNVPRIYKINITSLPIINGGSTWARLVISGPEIPPPPTGPDYTVRYKTKELSLEVGSKAPRASDYATIYNREGQIVTGAINWGTSFDMYQVGEYEGYLTLWSNPYRRLGRVKLRVTPPRGYYKLYASNGFSYQYLDLPTLKTFNAYLKHTVTGEQINQSSSIVMITELDMNRAGTYPVILQYTDNDGRRQQIRVWFVIKQRYDFTASDLTVYAGASLPKVEDFKMVQMDNSTGTKNYLKNDEVKIDYTDVDMNKPGTYKMKAFALNDPTQVISLSLTVKEKPIIDMTFPTSVLFMVANPDTKEVTSPIYKVKNNSKIAKVKVGMDGGDVIKITENPSNILFLAATMKPPAGKKEAMYLTIDAGNIKKAPLFGFQDTVIFGTLDPRQEMPLGFGGDYYGDVPIFNEPKKFVGGQMNLHLAISPN